MKTLIRLDNRDIEKIIAEKFDVPFKNVSLRAISYVALGGSQEYEISCEIDKNYPSDTSVWESEDEFKLSERHQ